MFPWKPAFGLGVLAWLVPFLLSFALAPLRQTNAAMFTTVMFLVLVITSGALLVYFFRRRPVRLRVAVLVGAFWMVISLALDYPIFSRGPMRMSTLGYFSEIGLAYLVFPVLAVVAALLAKHEAIK
jgi:hypothetical protein